MYVLKVIRGLTIIKNHNIYQNMNQQVLNCFPEKLIFLDK